MEVIENLSAWIENGKKTKSVSINGHPIYSKYLVNQSPILFTILRGRALALTELHHNSKEHGHNNNNKKCIFDTDAFELYSQNPNVSYIF